jgi:hypothetical protein
MNAEIVELEEYLVFSQFLDVARDVIIESDEDQDKFNIYDESEEDISFENVSELNDQQPIEGDKIDCDLMECMMNMIEIDDILKIDCPEKRRKGERRWGVHPLNQMRREQGHFQNLFEEMLVHDHDKFFNYTRMTPERFQHLFELVEQRITKESPNAIPAKCRLLLTLRYFN